MLPGVVRNSSWLLMSDWNGNTKGSVNNVSKSYVMNLIYVRDHQGCSHVAKATKADCENVSFMHKQVWS